MLRSKTRKETLGAGEYELPKKRTLPGERPA